MTSRYEQFVAEQRKRAEKVRNDALNGTLTRNTHPAQSITSRSDMFRRNIIENPPVESVPSATSPTGHSMAELKAMLPPALTDMNPAQSTFARAANGDKQAQATFKQATGVNIVPNSNQPKPSQYELNNKDIEAKRPKGKIAGEIYGATIEPFAKGMNWLTQGNPVGRFVSRTVGTGGSMLVGERPAYTSSTGNSTADKVADVLGTVGGYAGMAFNPAAPGIKGQNLLTAPLEATQGALMSRGGQALTNGLARGINRVAPNVSAGTANSIARGAIEGAATGAIGNTAYGMLQGQDSGKDIASNALLGAGLGAAGDVVARGIGSTINRRLKIEEPPTISPEPTLDNVGAKATADATETASKMKGNWFTNLFGNNGVGISAFGSTKRVGNAPLTTGDQIVRSGIKNDVQGVKDSFGAQARSEYQNFVDRLSPLKKINDQTYESAMDTARANNIANTIVRDKFVTPEGEVVGEGLNSIFKKVARGQDKDFVDYLILRHAKTRMERGERVYAENLNMTPQKVQERIDKFDKRHPEFNKIAAEWDTFNSNLLKHYGVDGDLMTQEMYNTLREKNPNYAPMRRQFSRSEKPGRKFLAKTTSSSFSGQKAPIKEVSPTGSVRNIIDPRKTTVENVGAFVNASLRNRVMVSMVDAIKNNPEKYKGIAEIVKKPKDTTDIRKILLDGGPDDFAEALNDDFKNLFKTTRVDQDNIVRAMVKGEPVYIQVHDPEIVKTLIGMGPQASNVLIDTLSAFSNATKRGATGVFAPIFAVKGATMDLVQSAIQAKNPAKQAAYTVYSIFSGIGDRLNIPGLKNLAEEYRRAGGEYSAALKGDRKLNTNISDMTRYPLLSPQGIKKGVTKAVSAPFKALEEVGNIFENAPRVAAYKLEMNRLGGQRTPENVRQAMSQAREITTNFSRKGALSRDIEALVPYNNAAVQGTYRVLSGIKRNPVRTVAAIGALSVLPKLYEYAHFHDDPDYQNLPARERYRFLIVNKNDDGTFTKIPMEPAYNSFGELTIEALRRFKDNDPTAFKGAMDALANSWTPPLVTGALQGVTQGGGLDKSIAGTVNATVAAPFVALTANQSFTGAPIVSPAVADRSPQYQYDEKTSAVAKKLGQVTGMSPMKVDYLIRSYGGDPARLLLPLTSDVGQGNTRNTLLKNFIVDPAYTTTLTEDFYNAKDKLNQAYHDHTEANVPLPDWYNENLRKSLNSTAKGSISKRLSSLRDKKNAINADKTLSNTEKTRQLREIQSQINNIYVDINSKLQDAGVLGGK